MAIAGIGGFDIGGTVSSILSVVWMIIELILIFGITGGIIWYVLRAKRYNTQTVTIVTDPETGTIRGIELGKGGAYVDSKTKNKRFFIKGTNVGLDPDKTPELPVLNAGSFTPKRAVLLVRSGFKSFRYLRPYITPDKQFDFSVGEEDVNWGINAYEKQKALYGTSFWDKLLPYIPLIIVGVIQLIVVIYFFKQLPQMKDILLTMKDLVVEMGKAKMGTVITA
jgi:hypothetical protein